MPKPEILNIIVDDVLENKESTLSPAVKWKYYDPEGDSQYSYSIDIGSFVGGADV